MYRLNARVQDTGGPVCFDDRAEVNDDIMSATAAASISGREFDGAICAGDEDWFRIPLGVGQGFRADLGMRAGADLDLRLYSGDTTDPDTTPLEAS